MNRLAQVSLVVIALSGCAQQVIVDDAGSVNDGQFDKQYAAQTRVSLALKYLELGNTEQAKLNLERAATFAPHSPDVHLARAHYFQTVQDVASADQAYQHALRLSPANPDVQNNYGVFLCQQARYEEADRAFNKALSHPQYAKLAGTYENAGNCALMNEEFEAALQYFSSSIAHNSRNPAVLIQLAELQLQNNVFNDAERYLQQYEAIAQASAQSLWLRVQLAAIQDQLALTEKYGRLLLSTFPNSDQAKRYLANEY